MQHPKLCKLNIGDSIFNRLDFVRLLIQVEKHARPSAEEEAGEEVNKFACFRMSVAEQKNVVIDYFLGMLGPLCLLGACEACEA